MLRGARNCQLPHYRHEQASSKLSAGTRFFFWSGVVHRIALHVKHRLAQIDARVALRKLGG